MRSQIFTAASAVVLSLAFGVGCAYAGATGNEGGPTGKEAAGATQSGPAAPNAQHDGSGDRGAMPGEPEGKSAAQPSPGSAQTGERSEDKSDKGPKGAAKSEDDRGGKSAERGKDDQPGDRRGREAADSEDRPGGKTAEREGSQEESTRGHKDGTTAESRDKNDPNGDGKRAQFEPRDKEKVRTYFSEHRPNVKRVDRDRVSVSIGGAIPGSIALYPLPAGVIIVADCPLQYFLWGNDVVIVDSCSREVVDIVPNLG